MENQQGNGEERTITLTKLMGYIVGALTYIFGFEFIVISGLIIFNGLDSTLSFPERLPLALMVFCGGLVLFPTTAKYIEKKFNFKMTLSLRYVIGFTLCMIGSVTNAIHINDTSKKSNYSSPVVQKKPERKLVIQELGEALITDYFEVTINKYSVMDYVDTGNMFARLKREEGSQYLILYTSFKNIDSESRSIFDGNLVIYYNEKPYVYDVSETLLLDGWGIYISHRVNPLTTYKTNIVYKIPKELKGRAFYYPSRNNDKGAIYLGEIN
jgi:hypothetical protein